MEDTLRSDHFFESGSGSGVLVYVIDADEPVCLKFSSLVKIQVLLDNWSKTSLDTHIESSHAEVVGMEGQSGLGSSVSVDAAQKDKNADHADSEPGDVCRDSELENVSQRPVSEKWKLKGRRRWKKCMPNGESKDSGLSKRAKRQTAAQSNIHVSHYKKKEVNRQNDERGHEFVEGNDFEYSKLEDGSESDHQHQVYSKKLRSSDKALKLSVKFPATVKTSKADKTLLQSQIRKRSAKSKKYLANQIISTDIKSEQVEELDVQVKDRPRKLLVDKAIKCGYCMVDFKNQQAFYDHRRVEESVHTCGICGKVEPYEAHLIVHMQRHRRVKVEAAPGNADKSCVMTESPPQSGIVQQSEGRKAKKEKMKCNICGLVVSSMDSLKIHTFLHTGEYAYSCCVCGEHFSSLSSRQHHMDIHISAQRFKCNPCGERFTSRAELAKHQLTHEIKCALCGETFPNKTSRTCHFRVSHPNDILKCAVCSNLFATMEDLEKHMTYHKKGKKEQCPICGIVVSKLKDHMLMHSLIAQEKLYACDQCPMRYLRKSNLDRHMRTHTGEKPYACNRCPKSFRSNGMLRKHLLTHTKERPYQCEVCGKQCSLRSNLNIHMRVHNTDRHFSCSLCSQSFNHKNSLHGHMKNKHGQEMNVQEMRFNISANHPHEPPVTLTPSMVSEMGQNISYNDKHFQNLDMSVGLPLNAGSDLLKVEKLERHPDYRHMHAQIDFPADMPGNMAANLYIENDRISLNKYDLNTQTNHTHGY